MFQNNVFSATGRWMLAALMVIAPAISAAKGHIDVSLTAVDPNGPGARVVVTLINNGDAPVHVLDWVTGFVGTNGRLPNNVFDVRDQRGNRIAYRGHLLNFGAPTMASFRLLTPGEKVAREVNLASEYRFEPNQVYSIGYEVNLDAEPDADTVSSAARATFLKPVQLRAKAEPITVFFGDTVASSVNMLADGELTCTSKQINDVLGARFEAQRRLFAAEIALEAMYTLHADGAKLVYQFHPHPRYTRWFGVHDDSEPNRADPEWGLNDNARVHGTVIATVKRMRESTLDAKCGCPGWPEATAAHIVKDEPYTMYFCPKFFALPEFDAYASRAGTVMHELTHFNNYYPGTDDFGAYGRAQAEKFAKEDRSTAVRNAENFEFFFTDTTPYNE